MHLALLDHGQTQGATFSQRYGLTLMDLVKGLVREDMLVGGVVAATDAWMHFNDLLKGDDPLEAFCPSAAGHLLREDGFRDCHDEDN